MRENTDEGIKPGTDVPAGTCGTGTPGQPAPGAASAGPPAVAKPKLPDPKAVLADPALTREEKIEKLRRWSIDARRVEASNDDGLQGAVTPSNLPAIQEALRQLGVGEDPAATQAGLNP